MDMIKRVLFIVFFGIFYYSIVANHAFCDEKEQGNNDGEVQEMEEMLEALKYERVKLDKLKSKLVDTVKQKEDEKKLKKEKELTKNERMILTNFVKKSEVNKKEIANKFGDHSTQSKEVEVKESFFQDNEDDEIEKSKKVTHNGNEIIHPFEIAESLYKSGEYKAAVDIYKLVLKNNIEKDKKMWITYQIANCYRKLKLYTDAINVYTEMRKEYEGTYWAKQAQWYIQDIEWRSKMEGKLDSVIKR